MSVSAGKLKVTILVCPAKVNAHKKKNKNETKNMTNIQYIFEFINAYTEIIIETFWSMTIGTFWRMIKI